MIKLSKETRPKLSKKINLSHFKNFYWLKKELIDFCREQGLSVAGSKQVLEKRVEIYISSGAKAKLPPTKTLGDRDSKQPITRDSPVVNYKNDAATRRFFVEEVGRSFHFNTYLRKFTDRNHLIGKNLTYGDLVDGWLVEEKHKADPSYQSTIGEQFEYNRFIRDFFLYEKGKTRADAIKAWKIVKTAPGGNSYLCYKSILLGVDVSNEMGKK